MKVSESAVIHRFVLKCSLALLLTPRAFPQVDADVEQGMKPYGAYHGGDIDTVSLTNGNLMIHVPIWSAPQRGNQKFEVVLIYDNKSFTEYKTPDDCTSGNSFNPCTYFVDGGGAGVGITTTQDFGGGCEMVASATETDQFGNHLQFNQCTVSSWDGATHTMADTGDGYYRAIDASGYRMTPNTNTNSATSAAGLTYVQGVLTDANGNQVGNTDTLGRTVPQSTVFNADTSKCPNLGYSFQVVNGATIYNSPGPNGTVTSGTTALLFCYANVQVRTGFFGGATTGMFRDFVQAASMLQSVVLPDGTFWAFQYDAADPNNSASIGYGDLLKITFPTGGSISYTWTNRGACPRATTQIGSRTLTSRTVDANDGTGPKQWLYQWGTSAVLVTDPLNNDALHTFTGLTFFTNMPSCSLYETQVDFYQGSQGSGTLLKTVKKDYAYTGNPYDNSGGGSNSTVAGVVPIRETTILPNGLTTKVETDYDTGFVYRGPFYGNPSEIGPLRTETYTVTYGLPVARREYDWGRGAPGPLLRQTATTYEWQINSAYLAANMLNLPATVQVLDGSGNLCAETDYFYDESGYLTTPSPAITTQHVAPPAAVRGNLTTVRHKLSPTPCAANATWTNVDSHTNWFDTGEVYQSIDPLGHTTTHTYDTAYAGAYPTRTCNALNQCVSGGYDFNTGLTTSFTDANQQTSNFSYDQEWRLTQALFPTDPASGVRPETDFDYSVLDQVKRSKKLTASPTTCAQTPSACIIDYAYFDGLGRTKQTRLVDPAGDDFVDTTYDSAGRVATVSNPHRSSPSTTDGSTQTQYDALARPTLVTKPDGSVSQMAYDVAPPSGIPGNCATSTDEAGKQRMACSDALGRLTTVFEDPAGLNYETDYQYDALGNLLRVDQKGSAPTTSGQWRTRLFAYDSLSRLLTAYNPESGTICYGVWVSAPVPPGVMGYLECLNGYDANGNLLAKTDAQGITTSYTYDPLNRVTQKTFSNGDPTLTFTYDQSPDPTWGAGSSVGHLVRALKAGLGSHWFRYDVMGRVSRSWQCLPSNCSAGASVGAQYDLAGGLTQLTYPNGQIVNYTPDSAGRDVSAIDSGARLDWPTGTTSNTGTTTNFVTAATYGPDSGLTGFISGANAASGFAGITNTFVYNNRLQLCRTAASTTGAVPTSCTNSFGNVLDLNYDYHPPGTGDNGNVYAITNYRDTTRSQTFAYDSLNRLTSAQTNGTDCTKPTLNPNQTEYWGNSYAYDAWGNLLAKTVTKCSAENLNENADAQNRMHVNSGTDYTYDLAGNMTYDATGGHNYIYDGQSQITQVDSGATATYTYDAEGHRLRKDSGSSPSTEYVYFGDDIIAEKNVNVPLQASMLTQSGLTAFIPGGIGDGNVNSYGWHTDSASAGAWLQVDLGSARDITGVGIYASSSGYAGNYNVQYSDNASSWSQAGSITPDSAGWNAATWSSVGAHRYWRLFLANTPGVGPWLTELQLEGSTPWTNYIFFDGHRVARQDFSSNAVSYYFSDHLKTADVITDSAGNIKSESDYYPWGGELSFVANDSNHYKFTGKERDSETQLDYFGARYYSNGLGRFITPDWSATPVTVPYADLYDPQSLNQYSYVRNIPTVKVDPQGHDCPTCPTTLPEPTAEDIKAINEAGERALQEAAEREAAKDVTRLGGELLGDISLVVGVAVVVYQLAYPESVDSGELPKDANGNYIHPSDQTAQGQTQAPVIEDARKSSRTIRRKWEKSKGKDWPKDADGKNYDADHKRALADGGSNSPRNIQPRTRTDHVNRHKKNGDFRRWAKRAHRKQKKD